jgi:predicted DNA-binding transcriptional regulator AlpA
MPNAHLMPDSGASSNTLTKPPEKLLSLRQVRARVPASDCTIWRWRKIGKFPQPDIRMPGVDYWRESTIDAFVAGEWTGE